MNPDSADALYVGLISGTSLDGIDAGVFRFEGNALACLAGVTVPYADSLAQRLRELRTSAAALHLDELGRLDRQIGAAFAAAANAVIARAGIAASDVVAIGSHGQTVRHAPDGADAFTLQLGDPHTIAATTGIDCVADFRRADVARGGQGAPLLPLLHDWLFRTRKRTVAVVNLGGIANVTLLPPTGPIVAFDTGPANTLLDQWLLERIGEHFDRDGRRAAAGAVNRALLAKLLADPYFARPAPKSTGFEYFNLAWLASWQSTLETLAVNDVVATLTALSVKSVAGALQGSAQPRADEIWLAGGGAHNATMVAGLEAALAPVPVAPLAARGIDADRLEAAGFAWLARERLAGRVTRHTEITGATQPVPLGVLVPAT